MPAWLRMLCSTGCASSAGIVIVPSMVPESPPARYVPAERESLPFNTEDNPDWRYVADVVALRRAETAQEVINMMRRTPYQT